MRQETTPRRWIVVTLSPNQARPESGNQRQRGRNQTRVQAGVKLSAGGRASETVKAIEPASPSPAIDATPTPRPAPGRRRARQEQSCRHHHQHRQVHHGPQKPNARGRQPPPAALHPATETEANPPHPRRILREAPGLAPEIRDVQLAPAIPASARLRLLRDGLVDPPAPPGRWPRQLGTTKPTPCATTVRKAASSSPVCFVTNRRRPPSRACVKLAEGGHFVSAHENDQRATGHSVPAGGPGHRFPLTIHEGPNPDSIEQSDGFRPADQQRT